MTDPDRTSPERPLAPGPTADRPPAPRTSSAADVQAFLQQVAALPPQTGTGTGGRLIFAMDATASRQPTWDRAQHIQARMFEAASGLGGLQVQLVFYRGFRECKASAWVSDGAALLSR